MEYRADIDGLRAIAILFVLFFHGGLKLFPSGFVGVDIFFVISGFLITGIIHQSLQNNRFSLSKFYSRRLWRMQPVFICLIVITTLLSVFFYLPDDLVQYSKSARKTSLFISNKFFETVTTGYFAPDSNQLPLLHTWSLSIEWQCYLILPIAIYLLHRIFAQHNITKIVYLLTLLFFALSFYFSLNYPTKAYYQSLSRIFEFLIGSCVALGHNRFLFNKYFLNLISLAAILTLFYIATRSDISLGFPNWYAFILCIATAVLISAGKHNPKPILTQLLSVKPLVFIGLISYSLYIWHWPLFALIRYLGFAETTSVLLLTFSLVFFVAYLSWRFIEKPARQFNGTKFNYSLIFLFILPVTIIHINAYATKMNEGYPQRFEEASRIFKQLKKYAKAQRGLCLEKKNIAVNIACALGAKNSNSQTGFMIGDSFSNHSWGFMDTLGREANLSILAHATESCLTLPGLAQYAWYGYSKNGVYQACYEQTARYYNMIKANHYDYVIMGQNWTAYLNNLNFINQLGDERSVALTKERIATALDKALQIITASGAKPVIIKAIALTENNLHNCLFNQIKRRTKYNPEQCNYNYLQTSDDQWFNDLLLRMKRKYTQLIIIDLRKVQCPKGRCMASIDGIPVFRDTAHIHDYASYQLGKLYLQHYKNPLVA